MTMKAFGAMLLAAGLLVVFSAGCKEKKEEPITNAPAQPAHPAFPEEQVPKPEPQPVVSEAPPPQPVDTTAKPRAHTSEHAASPAPQPMPKENYSHTEKKVNQVYIVKKGDTLQKISQKAYGTTTKWRKIYDANKKTIKNPDKLSEGEKLIIP
jgi:nucleoid-associated protein YgaU